ncbi:MAG: class I SAM-dependent methyltransferase [Gemmatimonadaceae bacterium]|nr:class I SAM-dependent methyltransferase [Gemmatimonadaceae bacterium]
MSYNRESVAKYFDEFGDREWTRLQETPLAEVKLHVHAHYLRQYIAPGSHVLDIGAGAGRFTQILASLGASVAVADISPVQLALNKTYASAHNFAAAVTEWTEADICELSRYADSTFDAVVCYGGPLSYVFERRSEALNELCRVTKPGGYLFLSVMSLWGTIHEKLPGVLATDAADNARIVATGELRFDSAEGNRHQCHLFRADEFRALLRTTGWEVLALAASNCLSTAWGAPLEHIRADESRWAELLAMEVEATQESGCVDAGSHMIAVIRRPRGPMVGTYHADAQMANDHAVGCRLDPLLQHQQLNGADLRI